jgi:alpha-tubulin suppressor-like RCC1 family protein
MGFRHPEDSHRTVRFLPRGRSRSVTAAVVAQLALGALALVTAVDASAAEKPVNTLAPTIYGTAREGSTLRIKKGEWTGGSLVYSYQWQRCEPEAECANIPSATGTEYVPRYVDIGSTLRAIVTATNSAGSTAAITERTLPVAAIPPKNTELPVISGVAEEGQLLSVSTGTWGGTVATRYTYRWERCTPSKHCSEIVGAAEATYRVAAADIGDTLRAIVTDENPAASKSATSLPTATVTHGPPVPVGLPSITGRLREGGTLEAKPGGWAGTTPIEFTYAWESCREGSCAQASGPSYALAAGDVGNTIRVTVTARNSLGSATASSVATPQVLSGSDDFAVGWGEDLRGQLGTVYRTPWEETPVADEGENGISAIAAGGSFSLELRADGTVAASGAGYYGSIGYGGRKATWEQGKSHVTVSGLSEVKAISAGAEYALALLQDGNVEAWGNNGYGTLGNGTGGFEKETGENQLVPKNVRALNGLGVASTGSGGGANFAVLGDGKVMAWGHNNAGQLGVAWPEECKVRKTCEPNAKKPSEEPEHKEAEHKCYTEVGWELCSKLPTPVVEAGGQDLEHVVAVRPGWEAAYALLDDGEVVSWGSDGKGQLGQTREPGAHTTFSPPGRVMVNATEPLKHVVAIAGGQTHALALLEDGRVVGWGNNAGGALGELSGEVCGHENKNGGGTWPCSRYATPITALDGVDVTAIATGSAYSVVLGSEGKVYTVGSNQYGQQGHGPGCENEGGEMGYANTCYFRSWTAVPGLEDVHAISAGLKSVIALLGSQAAPPLPVVSDEPQALSLKLEWALPNGESSERLSYRLWEHPGEDETLEGEGSEGEGEEPIEEGTGEPPINTTLPRIRVIEIVEGEKKVVTGEAAVGQILETTPGNWTGTQPISYEYQWLRCKSSSCVPIAGATQETYELVEEDAGHTLKVTVTARNGVKPHGVATSEPTEIIKAAGEGRSTKAESVKLTGQNGYLIEKLLGNPLEPVQYEVKLTASAGARAKLRTMVVMPLP